MAARGRRGVFLSDLDYRRLFWSAVAGRPTEGCDRVALVFDGSLFTQWQRSRLVLLLALMGEAGLRVGEAVGLGYETFRPALNGSESITLPASLTKMGRSRTMVVNRIVRYCALVHVEYARQLNEHDWQPDRLVTCRRSVPMSVRGAQGALVRAGHKYLGKAVWPHDLRRTFGDRTRRMSDVRIAQLELGHVRLETTQAYLDGSLAERLAVGVKRAEDLWPVALMAAERWYGAKEQA